MLPDVDSARAVLPDERQHRCSSGRRNGHGHQRAAVRGGPRNRYPGAIGELLSQELLSWMVFGHLLGSDLIMRVADDLLVEEPESL